MFKLVVGGLVVGGVVVGLGMGWLWWSRAWNEKERITVIEMSKNIKVISVDPVAKVGVEVVLPDRLQIESVGGRGNWLAKAIGQAGEEKWVADSVASYLGVSIDYTSSSLGWWDRWRFNNWRQEVKAKVLTLESESLTERKTLPDGLEILTLGPRWDELAQKEFADINVLREGVSVQVVNTTQTPGMGSSVARWLTSRGIKVAGIKVANSEVEDCVVRTVATKENSATLKYIMRVFGCKLEPGGEEDDEVELVVGRAYRRWWIGE